MKLIYLAKRYDVVVGDTFELFYRGIICLNHPYQYYIHVTCDKGNPYPRYFTFTPQSSEVGVYPLTITLYDDDYQIVDQATTFLEVIEPEVPQSTYHVLCIGDSLTANGVWPKEGYRRLTKMGGQPEGLGYANSLKMIGTCKTNVEEEEIGYEGYGCWTWKSYCTSDIVSMQSPVWIEVDHHKLDENDQHSIWRSENLEWILETIEEKRLKFKRGAKNTSPNPPIGATFTHVFGGIHHDAITVQSYEFELGNPFWNREKGDISFQDYIIKHQFQNIDLVYILLTWNGLYVPYNTQFQHHTDYAKQLLRKIHQEYPQAHITLLGIQICSVNGGIASNYGAHGPYSDTLGTITTAFHYNDALMDLTLEDEFKDYVRYVDTKAQFDSEYNMPMLERKVNVRSSQTEWIGTNGVHPSMNGYLQIGDVFYRALVKDIKQKNQEYIKKDR